MDRTDELEKVEQTIKDTEARLKTLQLNIEDLDSEIKKIAILERTIVENVKILKTKQIIAVAKEFRNSKEELKRIRIRLVTLKNEREDFHKAHKDTGEFLKHAQLQRDKIAQENDNNVIKFRREDGKE